MKYIITNKLVIPYDQNNFRKMSRIVSFRCRYRSLSVNSINLIKRYWKYIGIDFKISKLDLNIIFNTVSCPVILDIGFGDGYSLIHTSLMYKEYNIIGIEVYIPSIYQIINKLYTNYPKIKNIKIIFHDAVEVLKYMINSHSLHIIQIFFPDPWVKVRHHKRRMINKQFLMLLCDKLIDGGILHIITDCRSYMMSIINIINDMQYLLNISEYFDNLAYNSFYFSTKFAKKAMLKNHIIYNLVFIYLK